MLILPHLGKVKWKKYWVLIIIGVLVIFLCYRGIISQYQLGQTLAYLVIVGVPLLFLLRPFFESWKEKRRQEAENAAFKPFLDAWLTKRGYSGQIDAGTSSGVTPAPAAQPTETKKQIITPAQIAAINNLRSNISLDEISRFPKVRISGKRLENVIPEAGIFTAKINKEGAIVNVLCMFSTFKAVAEFASGYETAGTEPAFWSEGHLIPFRDDIGYSVFLMTAFSLNGRYLSF